jgi:circadian clock protein KaiC
VLDQELRSADSLLLQTAAEMGAQRIFIDGIRLLRQPCNAGAPLAILEPGSYRDTLQQLIEAVNREHLTAMLSHELGERAERQLTSEAAEFLVDTVIRVKRTLYNRRIHRSIEIVKSRGQDYDPGEHTLSIQNGEGLEVSRRVQAPVPFS